MIPKKERVSRLAYCQYLLVSQINYTLTNYAEHTEKFSHDMANRYLSGDEIRPRLVWENVSKDVVQTPYGFLVFVRASPVGFHLGFARRPAPGPGCTNYNMHFPWRV